jgi:outer membrane protein OmpA-like peptidoglycan-associated protein
MRQAVGGILILAAIMSPCAADGFPSLDGGRGLFRVEDARGEGYGVITLKGTGVYRSMLDSSKKSVSMFDAPVGLSYSFTQWLEIYGAGGYSIALNSSGGKLGFLPSLAHHSITDARVGGKVCLTSWLPVLKVGLAGYHQFALPGVDTVHKLLDYPLPYGSYNSGSGLVTLDLRDVASNIPITLHANYGMTEPNGARYDALPGRRWSFTGVGAELSSRAFQLFGEFTDEDTVGKALALLGSSLRDRRHLSIGGRVKAGILGISLVFDKGLTSNLPDLTYTLGLSLSTAVASKPAPGGTMVGTVVDARTGAVLPAVVTLPQTRGFKGRKFKVNPDGTFKLTKIPNGSVLLNVDVPGYQRFSSFIAIESGKTTIQSITLTSLTPVGTITGKVTDAGNGAPVDATLSFPGSKIADVKNDPSTGLYKIDGVAKGVLTVTASAAGYRSNSASVVVQDNQVTTQDFTLNSSASPVSLGTIAGHVQDALTGKSLAATIAFPESSGLASVTSDSASGAYSVGQVPSGTIVIDVSDSGYRHEARPVAVVAGQIAAADFKLQPNSEVGSISGTITDASTGSPVRALISFTDTTLPRIETDSATGFYKLDGIPVGVSVMKVTADGYFPTQMAITVELNRVTNQSFALNQSIQTGQLTGLVRDLTAKTPLKAFVYFPNSNISPVVSDSVTGFYRVQVPLGTIVAACSLPGYARQVASTPITIKKDEPAVADFDLLKIGTEITLTNAAIHFASASAEIQPDGYPALDDWVKLMKDNPLMTAEIQGHTDAVGSDTYNQKLSERRAQAVADYLVSQGVDRPRLTVVGYGKSRLLIQTQDANAQNRRVVFKVTGEQK